ncbi:MULTISPECIES: hypothetical protein [Enterobacterales]|uniref:hypothetical protein n=1 Tax=Enterobacterales TaxID=91347 RepID=UPI00086C96AA|nr:MULTISPECIES: hypothetical protein [Enterobacterales]MCT6518323.1 hypothetical protein [Proteus vulgaris]OEJ07440.1 hypothetical protein BHE89_16995 [Shigella sp. FC1967]WOO48403.1 hypothetical protein R2S03_12985 [Hafnia alvei]WPF02868.1 hypothetical protein SB028_11820 [Proteus vulgaris]
MTSIESVRPQHNNLKYDNIMDGLMKLPLLFITLSFCAVSSLPAVAASTQCTETEKQANIANSDIMLLISYNGPVKSVTMTSTIPHDGRFKALKGEIHFDECGKLLKDSTSMQEYVEGNVETHLIRTLPNNPSVIRYQFQIKNAYGAHSIYMQETYHKNGQNQFNKRVIEYYANDGTLLDTITSQFDYQDGRIVKETSKSSDPTTEAITTEYQYNPQGKLQTVIEDGKINVEYQYDREGKVITQSNYVKGINGEDKSFITTCLEWDKFANCSKEELESTIKFNDEVINFSKATLHNEFIYYE